MRESKTRATCQVPNYRLIVNETELDRSAFFAARYRILFPSLTFRKSAEVESDEMSVLASWAWANKAWAPGGNGKAFTAARSSSVVFALSGFSWAVSFGRG